MCIPHTLTAVRETLSRRDFFKLGAGAAAAAALAPTVGNAQPRQVNYRAVQDLTHVFGTATPVFPGFRQPTITIEVTVADDGYYANTITYGEHTATHIDAPAHFAPAGLYVDQIPASSLVAPLCVVDITARAASNPDTMVQIDDLIAWERRHGRLPVGAAVFMNSGWATRYSNPAAFLNQDAGGTMHFPGFSPAAAEFLLTERSVVGIGVDTLSLDIGAATAFGVHATWLGANRWGMENLAHLDAVPPSGATVVVGAPKVATGSGGPTRVIALY